MKEDTDSKKIIGVVKADHQYTQMKYLVMNNKLRTQKHNESIRSFEINRNN